MNDRRLREGGRPQSLDDRPPTHIPNGRLPVEPQRADTDRRLSGHAGQAPTAGSNHAHNDVLSTLQVVDSRTDLINDAGCLVTEDRRQLATP